MDAIFKLSRLSEWKSLFDPEWFYSCWTVFKVIKMLLQICPIPEDIKSDTTKAILWIELIGKWSQIYLNGVWIIIFWKPPFVLFSVKFFFFAQICGILLYCAEVFKRWCVFHLSHSNVLVALQPGRVPCVFTLRAAGWISLCVPGWWLCHNVLFSSRLEKHLPVFIKDIWTHQARITKAFTFHTKI